MNHPTLCTTCDLQLFHELAERTVELRASDLHLTAGSLPHYRIDSELVTWSEPRIAGDWLEQWAHELMTEPQRELFRRRMTVDLAYTTPNGHRFRVNVFRERGRTAMALRYLDNRFHTVSELNLPDDVSALAEFRDGLVVITGPTGSGKTTTLAALIHQINLSRACHIITIEDPVEYLHSHHMGLVRQRELYTDVPTFAEAVRAALREDPDVLLVGEMRDVETMRAAITAAETGHLVFTSLHTGDVVGVIDRIISVFPAQEQASVRDQLSRVLRAVMSQRLVRCRSGSGRVPVVEILRVNTAVANLIRTGEPHQIYSVLQTSAHDGMRLLEQSLAELVAAGWIGRHEAYQVARDPNILECRLAALS
ncbi:MAG: twitching motility protein PilT [Pirellulaceae bacterium]|nr:MAG: twitching motility protein PilT [Pirellulaceae bacterium]GIW92717.1 MAG: twitching motility protein PilT [Pirellulaceae bacterium]